jgi:hypothetical protein
MQDWAGATEPLSCCGETRSFETASTYIGIISLNYFASPCFRHTHLFFSPHFLTNQPAEQLGGKFKSHCRWNLVRGAKRVATMRCVTRHRDARHMNSVRGATRCEHAGMSRVIACAAVEFLIFIVQ